MSLTLITTLNGGCIASCWDRYEMPVVGVTCSDTCLLTSRVLLFLFFRLWSFARMWHPLYCRSTLARSAIRHWREPHVSHGHHYVLFWDRYKALTVGSASSDFWSLTSVRAIRVLVFHTSSLALCSQQLLSLVGNNHQDPFSGTTIRRQCIGNACLDSGANYVVASVIVMTFSLL